MVTAFYMCLPTCEATCNAWCRFCCVCAGRESGGGIANETEMASKNKADCRGLMPDGIGGEKAATQAHIVNIYCRWRDWPCAHQG